MSQEERVAERVAKIRRVVANWSEDVLPEAMRIEGVIKRWLNYHCLQRLNILFILLVMFMTMLR